MVIPLRRLIASVIAGGCCLFAMVWVAPNSWAASGAAASKGDPASSAILTGSSSGGISCNNLYSVGAAGTWKAPSKSVKHPSSKGMAVLIPTDAAAEAAELPIQGMQAAFRALGWKTQVIDGQGTPSVYNQAMRTAITEHATAILTVGIAPQLVENSLSAARKAGIVVISNAQTGVSTVAPKPPAAGYQADVSANANGMGKLMGRYIVCTTSGKVDLLPFDDPEYASSNAFVQNAVSTVKACSTCKVEPTINFSVTQLETTVPSITTSYLQVHPNVNGILSVFDPAAAVQVPAINAANLSKQTKLYSEYGDPQNLTFIRDGNVETATVAAGYVLSGWGSVDEMLRVIAKQPLVNENVPFALVTKTHNMPPAGATYNAGANYAKAYKKVWGLG